MKKMGIIAAFASLWVFVMMASMVDARVINKRAAFYIANDTLCIVDGDLYFNGDPVPTDDHCEKCTCRPPGFSCVLRDCEVKPGCKAVRKDGECCPDYVCGCSHNGNVYKDGDFIRDLQNPCYTCRCHGSSISCTFADCLFRSDCGPIYIQGECCPRYDHCPPLSTTQKTTSVITTVPITYDETTKPLFNLTSPPHERLATHTTIFPTTASTAAEGGETHTTETYVRPAVSDVSVEATQTTRGHEPPVTPSSDSSTSRVTQAHTSTVTTTGSKDVTEMSTVVHEDNSEKATSLSEETASKESFSTDTVLHTTDVVPDTETKEPISTPITAELSSGGGSLTEGHTTEEAHDKYTDESVTEVSHEGQTDEAVTEESHDTQTDETAIAEVSHDDQVDELVTGVSDDDKEADSEAELPSGIHTTQLVTEVSHVKQTDDSVEEVPHSSETDHTTLESDQTVSVSFSEETSKASFDVTTDTTQSVEDSIETTTGMHITHEELEVSSEDEVHSSHEAVSSHPEVEGESEGTSISLVNTVTMSGDSETELSPVKAFTATETHDITTHYTHTDAGIGDSSTESQGATAEGIHDDVADASLPAVTSHDDHETVSEVEDKTTFSGTEHSDFGDNESSTIHSETEYHSFSTGSTDDDDSTNELPTEEDEISTQNAEELNMFTGTVTPSGESEQSSTTVLLHISHPPSSEATQAQAVADELTEEQSVDVPKVAEDPLQTEQPEVVDSNVGDIGSSDDLLPSVLETTTTHSTEVPPSPQHTELVLHSHETITTQSSAIQKETTVNDGRNNEIVEEILSSLLTEDVTESDSDVSHSTMGHLTDQVHPLNEIVGEENAAITGTGPLSDEDHEDPHLLSEVVNALSPTDEFSPESEQVHAETEGSSQSFVIVTTEGTTETVITMEAESDLSLTTSVGSSATSDTEDASITSSTTDTEDDKITSSTTDTEDASTTPSEGLSVVFVSTRTTRAAETPTTQALETFADFSSTEVHESTAEHAAEDDWTIKPKEHELLFEKFRITPTVRPEQNERNEIAITTTEIPSDDLDHSEQLAEVSSIISEADDRVTSESSSSDTSDHISKSTVTEYSPVKPDDDDSGSGVSPATKSSESATTSPKQITEELNPFNTHNDDENVAPSADFMSASPSEEQHDTQKDGRTSVNELTTDSQGNMGSEITENISEITMDAEETILNHGFESITNYLQTTENYETSFASTTQNHGSVKKESSDSQDHYTVGGETYGSATGEHLRSSRSTSSNSMASSITVEYPEKPELQVQHTSETEKENIGTSSTTVISVSSFDNTEVPNDENKSVTGSLHGETTPTSENIIESTHSTILNSIEVSSVSSELSNEHSSASPNTDDSYVSQVSKLDSDETEEPNGAGTESNVDEVEDELREVSLASAAEISPSAGPGLLKADDIAPDLIIPAEPLVNAVPLNSAETENPIHSDHSTDSAEEHVANPRTTPAPGIISGIPDFESSETINEYSSESYEKNNTFERENNDDTTSLFSRTSERYDTDDVVVDNEASTYTTENQEHISSYTMDAEAETPYFDDSTDNNKEDMNHQSVNNSGETGHFESGNVQAESDFEDEELVGKEFQNGPEKGGEWFEPTVPVLSAINVDKASDETGTSADTSTNVKYSTSTEAVTMGNEEKFFVTDMIDQMQKSLDSEGSTNDLEHNTDQFFSTSVPETDLNTNLPTIGESQGDDAATIVSAKFTFVGDEANGSSTDVLKAATGSEVRELDEEDKLLEQTAVNGAAQEDSITSDQSDDSIRTTNSIPQEGEIESPATSEVEHRDAAKNDELREQKEIKGESSQNEVDNVGSQTTRESGTSLNVVMISDGVRDSMHFTDAITGGSDLITDHISTTESEALDEELEKGLQTAGSQDELNTDPEQVTTNEAPYTKDGNEGNVNEESTATEVSSNGLANAGQTIDQGHPFEKSTEISVSPGDHTEGLHDKNDDEYSTEHFSTSYYKVTPLPLLLFNEFVEKVKEDSLVNGNSQPVEEQRNTVQSEEKTEVVSHGTTEEELEKQQQGDSEISVPTDQEIIITTLRNTNDHEIGTTAQRNTSDHEISMTTQKNANEHEISVTTQRTSNEHDSVTTTPTSSFQDKQTEIYFTSFDSEKSASQNSYSTENVHSDHSPDETEKAIESTTSSQAKEQGNKSGKKVFRVFFIRRPHDDYYPSDEETPQKKEEYSVEKDGVIYSVKSPEISVNNPDDTNQEEQDKVPVTTEVVTQSDEESADDTHQRDLGSSSTSSSSIERISTIVEDAAPSGSSGEETFHPQPTEVAQKNDDEQSKDTHDDVSGPETTPDDSMSGDTA